jgi:alanine racemase
MIHPTIAHIDLQALLHNVYRIKKTAPQSKILAMVKSNAYGHGAIEIAQALVNDVSAFGVIFLPEAYNLFKAGIKKKVVILSGFFDAEDLREINELGFATVVHSFEQLAILQRAKLKKPLEVWLKLDTGMHRLGFQPDEAIAAYTQLMAIEHVIKPLHLMTHFSDADNVAKEKTNQQIATFETVIAAMDGIRCIANSSALLNYPRTRVDWIRPGITLYGVSPMPAKPGPTLGLKPVMTLQSRIIATHNLDAGETVGYGSTWSCPEKMRVGIVAIGYGDGYPRNVHQSTPVLINDVRCPIIGRVAMDLITVDLRGVPAAQVNDCVTLWGNGLPIEEVAVAANTIPYELFCRMTQRVAYKYC